jgi:hypothetical protein
MRITIRETTRGSAKQTFAYDVERIKLKTPFVQQIGDREVVREYELHVKAV